MALPAQRPGEQRTYIRLWDTRDPAKAGDNFYWLDGLKSADGSTRSGPNGQELGAFLAQARDGTIELRVPARGARPGCVVQVPVALFPQAEPDRTRVTVSHIYLFTPEERAARHEGAGGGRSPLPAEVEAAREDWAAAVTRSDSQASEQARRRFYAGRERHGFAPFRPVWPREAVEVAPGVFLADERPTQG
jgi:hypothetical protein